VLYKWSFEKQERKEIEREWLLLFNSFEPKVSRQTKDKKKGIDLSC